MAPNVPRASRPLSRERPALAIFFGAGRMPTPQRAGRPRYGLPAISLPRDAYVSGLKSLARHLIWGSSCLINVLEQEIIPPRVPLTRVPLQAPAASSPYLVKSSSAAVAAYPTGKLTELLTL